MPMSCGRALHRLGLTITLALLALAVFGASPVAGFPLSNCTMSLTSTDGTGATISTAQGGALDATQDDPFEVAWEGSVSWVGTTGSQVIKDYSYHVEVFGVPTPLRGGDANDGGDQDGDGRVGVAANSPFRATGLYFVSGGISGEGGSCDGSGWFLLLGDPIGTLPWFGGLGLGVIGLLGLVAGLQGHAKTAIVGGIVAGAGGGILGIVYAFLPVGENTPIAAILVGLILGILVGIVGGRMAAGAPGPDAEPSGA